MASNQMQQAKVVSDETVVMQPQRGTVVTMNNRTPFTMEISRYKNWSGEPSTDDFPATIGSNDKAEFTHLKNGQFGSVGAVQYHGQNTSGIECAWILAWQAPADTATSSPRENKVYVICGKKAIIDALTFKEILKNLEDSSTSSSSADLLSKTSVDAEIQEISKAAAVLSNFELTPP